MRLKSLLQIKSTMTTTHVFQVVIFLNMSVGLELVVTGYVMTARS